MKCIGCRDLQTLEYADKIKPNANCSVITHIKNEKVDGYILTPSNSISFTAIYYCPFCGRKLGGE